MNDIVLYDDERGRVRGWDGFSLDERYSRVMTIASALDTLGFAPEAEETREVLRVMDQARAAITAAKRRLDDVWEVIESYGGTELDMNDVRLAVIAHREHRESARRERAGEEG